MKLDCLNDPLYPTPFTLDEDDKIISTEGKIIGSYVRLHRRLDYDWEILHADPLLINLASNERSLWDTWASDGTNQKQNDEPPNAHRTIYDWFERYPKIKHSLRDLPVDFSLTNKMILDIGGSGKDMPYWLGDAPSRIDQVEVSPKSQALFADKIGRYKAAGLSVPEIFLHTIPAEHLPFKDGTFDFIFSRSTIHHCVRPVVLDQLFRVLKPGGVLLFAENYRGPLLRLLMQVHRRVTGRDRGSDDPLTSGDLEHIERAVSRTNGYCSTLFSEGTAFNKAGENPKISGRSSARLAGRVIGTFLGPRQGGLHVTFAAYKGK